MNRSAGIADMARQGIPRRFPQRDGCAAGAAKVHRSARGDEMKPRRKPLVGRKIPCNHCGHRIEEIDGLMGEVDALKAQIERLEDSRFALAVAHTEDVLTIERLAFEEKSWQT